MPYLQENISRALRSLTEEGTRRDRITKACSYLHRADGDVTMKLLSDTSKELYTKANMSQLDGLVKDYTDEQIDDLAGHLISFIYNASIDIGKANK